MLVPVTKTNLLNASLEDTGTIGLRGFLFMKEIWKDIPNYERLYQSSTLGRVKGLDRKSNSGHKLKGLILKQIDDGHGYLQVGLSKNGKVRRIKTHKLIAMTFLNHKPCGYTIVVDHIDNNSLNNRLDNLQLISHRKNCSKDKFRCNYSSNEIGVVHRKCKGKWESSISIKGKWLYLGVFTSEKEASDYYQAALVCVKDGRIKDIKTNKRKLTSKHKGVYFDKRSNRWLIEIRNVRYRKTKSFLTEEEAYQAVLNYKNK